MKTSVHLWQYLDNVLFERDVSGKVCKENQNTIYGRKFFTPSPPKVVPFMK
jgi:hypothetical protein